MLERLTEIAATAPVLARARLSRYSVPLPSVCDRLEGDLAALTGVQHALVVNSGTSALVCALAAVGVGPGDEVLVPAYTWISDAAAAVALGAVPVLVEVDESLTMDPDDLERKITPRSRAVVPVHMLNLVCDLERIGAVARRHGLAVVEDACQAIGVTYRGRRVGSIGDAGAFSFNQHKNIKAGEGGAVLTDDPRIAARAAMLHDVGSHVREAVPGATEPSFVGLNLRMSELTAAVLRPQVRTLDRQLVKRRRRRDLLAEHLTRQGLRLSPHHAPDEAVGLTVVLDDAESAVAFAEQAGVSRLLDTGRHVYTNWAPIVERRTWDPRANPWTDVERPADHCPVTLDVLSRSCQVEVRPGLPLPVVRARARTYTRPIPVAAGPSTVPTAPQESAGA